MNRKRTIPFKKLSLASALSIIAITHMGNAEANDDIENVDVSEETVVAVEETAVEETQLEEVEESVVEEVVDTAEDVIFEENLNQAPDVIEIEDEQVVEEEVTVEYVETIEEDIADTDESKVTKNKFDDFVNQPSEVTEFDVVEESYTEEVYIESEQDSDFNDSLDVKIVNEEVPGQENTIIEETKGNEIENLDENIPDDILKDSTKDQPEEELKDEDATLDKLNQKTKDINDEIVTETVKELSLFTSINATNIDVEPPKLVSVITDKSVYKAGEKIELRVVAEDETGLDQVSVLFENQTQQGNSNLHGHSYSSSQLSNGNFESIVYVDLPERMPSSSYNLRLVSLSDGDLEVNYFDTERAFKNTVEIINQNTENTSEVPEEPEVPETPEHPSEPETPEEEVADVINDDLSPDYTNLLQITDINTGTIISQVNFVGRTFEDRLNNLNYS